MRLSSLLLLGSNLALGYAASVNLVNPPNEVKLNDRKHPISVAYEGVNGEVRACFCVCVECVGLCVRLLGGKRPWADGAGRDPPGLFHILTTWHSPPTH